MKKFIIILIVLGIAVLAGLVGFKVGAEITRAKIINSIKIDGINEVDNGIITLEINGQYYDYQYEYNEEFKTIQDRINNGENVNEWAKTIY